MGMTKPLGSEAPGRSTCPHTPSPTATPAAWAIDSSQPRAAAPLRGAGQPGSGPAGRRRCTRPKGEWRVRLGIARERREGERRVAATPETVKQLVGLGLDVLIEAGAGVA